MFIKEKILLLLLAILSAPPTAPIALPDIALPQNIRQGDPLIAVLPLETRRILLNDAEIPPAVVEGKKLLIYGIPLNFKEKTIRLTAELPYGTAKKTIWIGERPRPEIPALFPPADKETQQKINNDRVIKAAIPESLTSLPLFSLSFQRPIDSEEITSPFGEVRGGSVHYGTDWRAKAGTPVRAIGKGKVVFAKNLFLEGNMAVIDHGSKVISYYLHLENFSDDVYEGKNVEKGDVIGYAGGTGQATGVHLHIAMKINGEFIDPDKFISEINALAR